MNTLKLATNMRVVLQNDELSEVLYKHLLDIDNGKIPVDASTGLIPFPRNFDKFTISSKEELITKVFSNIGHTLQKP